MTPREVEVLLLIADGLTNKEIARRLHLSAHTVGSYVNRILLKLQVNNRTQAAVVYHRRIYVSQISDIDLSSSPSLPQPM